MYIIPFKKVLRFNSDVEFIIGDCRVGKSNYACAQAQKFIKKGYRVYCNFHMLGTYRFDINDLMVYDFEEGAVMVFDEIASCGLASRGDSYKNSNTPNVIEFFTTYGHYKFEKIIIISPSFQDCIPVVRSRVTGVTVCKKPIITTLLLKPLNFILKLFKKNPIKFTLQKYISKHIDIVNKDGGAPEEVYKWIFLKRTYTFQNKWFKYFDSFTQKNLFKKDWIMW